MSQRYKIAIGFITALALVVLGVAITSTLATQNREVTAPTQVIEYKPATADDIFTLINKEREKEGLQALVRMTELDASAQYKADDMASRDYLGHDDPVTGKQNGVDRIFELTGQKCHYAGENYHYGELGYSTSKEAVKWWMDSKPHHDAILDPEHTHTGIGIATSSKKGAIQVQHFCKTR